MTERAERKEDVPFSVSQSLNEFLLQQLGLRDLPDKQMKIAEYIIGNIDDDGYLRRDLSAIADDLIFQAGQEVDEKEIESILNIIQDFEPAGVGARDLKECLLIQLDKKENTGYKFGDSCFDRIFPRSSPANITIRSYEVSISMRKR